MSKVYKYLTLVIMLIVMAGIEVSNTYANTMDGEIKDKNIVLLTTDVPESINMYVEKAFLDYTSDELEKLNFSKDEIKALELYPAVVAYEYDKCDDMYYYYPVVYNNNVIATITAFKTDDGEISLQFGKTRIAEAINDIKSTLENPAGLVIASDGLYVTTDGKIAERIMAFENCETNISNQLLLDKSKFKNAFSKIVNIGNDDECLVAYSTNILSYTTSSISSKTISVPFVANTSAGICWAASLSSIIKYTVGSSMTALQLRNYLVSNVSSLSSHTTGTMECAYDILNHYISSHTYLCYYNGWSSFNGIMNNINNNLPVYSDWQGTTAGAHAMVICGYYYNTSIPDSVPAARRITVMDPNQTSYISIYSNTNYNIGTKTYYLYGTVR